MVAIVYLPSAIGAVPSKQDPMRFVGFRVQGTFYLQAVGAQLDRWIHGQFAPPQAEIERLSRGSDQRRFLETLRQQFSRALPITISLVFAAFGASLLLGVGIGILISRLGPPWLRWPMWGAATLLGAVPDIIQAVAVDLGLNDFGKYTGLQWTIHPLTGPLPFKNYISPWLGLTLLAVPLVARVTAGAMEETADQLYVRSAVAKGLSAFRVLGKHVGRNALIRIWAVVPVLAGLLLSGAPIVEYMTETPGLGRTMILNSQSPTVISLYLLPFVAAFLVLTMLFDLGRRLIDPRPVAAGSQPARRDRGRWLNWVTKAAEVARSASELPGQLTRLPLDLAYALWDWLKALPSGAARTLRSLRDPILLSGLLLLVGFVAVAIFAPKLTPYDPNRQFKAYQDATGHIWVPPMEPHPAHPLGTDDLGRDMFSRLVYGTRTALLLAAVVTPLRFGIAVIFGLLAAWGRGLWLTLVRWLSTAFAAVPAILLPMMAIPTINFMFGTSAPRIALWLGAVFVAIPGVPRLAEAVSRQTWEVINQPYLESARAAGAGGGRTLLRYILPELSPQLITLLAMEIPAVMVTTFTLGYFHTYLGGSVILNNNGIELRPALAEWGSSLQQAPVLIIRSGHWWLATSLGAMVLAVAAFSLFAEGLRRRWRSRTGWQWGE